MTKRTVLIDDITGVLPAAVQTKLDEKAPLVSPAFTGSPTANGVALGIPPQVSNVVDGAVGWYRCATGASVVTNGATGPNSLRLVPFFVGGSSTFDRITAEVTTVGTSGSVVRLCIYQLNPASGLVGALVLDAGTIDGTVLGVQELTINQALTPGAYAIGGVIQGGGTAPQLRCLLALVGQTASNTPRADPRSGWAATVPSTLPANGAAFWDSYVAPLVYLRRSA